MASVLRASIYVVLVLVIYYAVRGRRAREQKQAERVSGVVLTPTTLAGLGLAPGFFDCSLRRSADIRPGGLFCAGCCSCFVLASPNLIVVRRMIISSSVHAGFAISCQSPSVALTGNSGGGMKTARTSASCPVKTDDQLDLQG